MRLYAAVQRVQFAKRFVNSDVVTWYYVYYRDDNRVFSKIHKTSQIGLAQLDWPAGYLKGTNYLAISV